MSSNSKARRKHSAAFKSKVAIEALKERQTLSELASKYELSPMQITQWKKHLLEHGPEVFTPAGSKKEDDKDALIEELYKKIGQYQVELDWLKKKSGL